MPRKTENVQVKIELLLFDKLRTNAALNETTVSEYVRALIIEDFIDRGLITNEELIELVMA